MVLESIVSPFKAENKPYFLILIGAVYAAVGMLIGIKFFPKYASVVSVSFTAIASMPLIYNTIKYEEEKDYHELQEKILIKEHSKAAIAYLSLFIGFVLMLTILYVIMPEQQVADGFRAQIETYNNINKASATGAVTGGAYFKNVVFNNLRVLILCILFSFVYGAGAIFILSWNASVIALAAGNLIVTRAANIAEGFGLSSLAQHLAIGSHAIILRYGLHGTIEILSYIVAGLAGGIISVAVIRHHYTSKHFEHIVLDSAELILVSLILLIIGAGVETWITPVFYV